MVTRSALCLQHPVEVAVQLGTTFVQSQDQIKYLVSIRLEFERVGGKMRGLNILSFVFAFAIARKQLSSLCKFEQTVVTRRRR